MSQQPIGVNGGNVLCVPPVHDLVIRKIAKYLEGCNTTLCRLMRVNKRFYGLRDIFIAQLELSRNGSDYAYHRKPYGWNKVSKMVFDALTKYFNYSLLSSLKQLWLCDCIDITDLMPFVNMHELYLVRCSSLVDLSPLAKSLTVIVNL